jgi:hypothetical protein
MAQDKIYDNTRTNGRTETMVAPGRQKYYKGLKLKRVTTSDGEEDIRQNLQEDRRTSGCKANSRDYHYAPKYECQDIVEGSAPSDTKEETANNVRAGDVGTPSLLGSFALTYLKSRIMMMMMMMYLDRLALYEGTARDERP